MFSFDGSEKIKKSETLRLVKLLSFQCTIISYDSYGMNRKLLPVCNIQYVILCFYENLPEGKLETFLHKTSER